MNLSNGLHQQKQNTTQGNNFCLAWFAPSGIQTISVSLDDDDDDEYDVEQDNIGSERGRTVSINANSCKRVTCCPEWRGYRHATEVLIPFGYATDFVRVSLFIFHRIEMRSVHPSHISILSLSCQWTCIDKECF